MQPFTDADVLLLESWAALVVVVAEHRIASGGFFTPALSATGSSPDVQAAVIASAPASTVPGEEVAVAVAVGMLHKRLGFDESRAIAVLRAHAFGAGRTIHEIARAVLTGGVGLDELAAPP